MATKAEKILSRARQIKEINDAEENRKNEADAARARQELEEAATKQRFETEVERKKIVVWSGTGIPELFENLCQFMIGASIEYKLSKRTESKLKRIKEKVGLFRSKEKYIKEEVCYLTYTIELVTGGWYMETRSTRNSDMWGGPEISYHRREDSICVSFEVVVGQEITLGIIFNQIGTLGKIEEICASHLSKAEQLNIRFKE